MNQVRLRLWEHHPLRHLALLHLPLSFHFLPPHITSPCFFFCHLCLSLAFALFYFSLSLHPPSPAVYLHPTVCCTTVVHRSPVSHWASHCPAPQSKQITVDILKDAGSNCSQWAGYVEVPADITVSFWPDQRQMNRLNHIDKQKQQP